jgi:hypothetical protein
MPFGQAGAPRTKEGESFMKEMPIMSKPIRVLAAGAILVLLAGALAVRISARGREVPAASPVKKTFVAPPPPSSVPAPKTAVLQALAVPCWSCPDAESWPVSFRTDLDLIAPLGTGHENAARWFKDFAKPSGARYPEAAAAMDRTTTDPADHARVLSPNDPLLLEAEPWCDQTTMRYYPDFFELKGFQTQIPNLLVTLTMGRSWVARGRASADPEKAMEDYRRTVRLGRLLRQEDSVMICDLVGLACIRLGTQAIYDAAIKRGDAATALTAAIVLGEHASQRLKTAEKITRFDLTSYLSKSKSGEPTLDVPDHRLDQILDSARNERDRRFRCEAMLQANLARFLGTAAQQERALAALNEMTASKDPVVAKTAVWSRENPPTKDSLQNAFR